MSIQQYSNTGKKKEVCHNLPLLFVHASLAICIKWAPVYSYILWSVLTIHCPVDTAIYIMVSIFILTGHKTRPPTQLPNLLLRASRRLMWIVVSLENISQIVCGQNFIISFPAVDIDKGAAVVRCKSRLE